MITEIVKCAPGAWYFAALVCSMFVAFMAGAAYGVWWYINRRR